MEKKLILKRISSVGKFILEIFILFARIKVEIYVIALYYLHILILNDVII